MSRRPSGTPSRVSHRKLEKYEIEEAARTIARAEEHKRNPQMMKAVRKHIATLHRAVERPPGKR